MYTSLPTCCSSGSGSGGGTGPDPVNIAFERVIFEQSANFTTGTVVIPLPQLPLANSVDIDYNGVTLQPGQFSVSGQNVTITFDDPYVTTYDSVPYFQLRFAYQA